MSMDLVEFEQALLESAKNGTFAKLTLSKPAKKSSDLKNVYLRLADMKGQLHFSFTYRYKTKDQVKNYTLSETWDKINELLKEAFRSATLMTTEYDIQVQISKKGKVLLNRQKPSITQAPDLSHDKIKIKRSSSNENYLYHLGITTATGEVIPKMADKYKQINKYLEIVDGLVSKANLPNKVHAVDMGSGKGYLTFALYHFLKYKKGIDIEITGIELRVELVDLCNQVAQKCGFDNLTFKAQSIESFSPKSIDILIALHACNTATDDALAKGILSQSALIICAPCCHKQIRQQVKGKKQEHPILRYGIFQERHFEKVTDTIRALLLEKNGYATKVFEFISNEHTAKNIMIVGTKTDSQVNKQAQEQITTLKAEYNIDFHYLEQLLNERS